MLRIETACDDLLRVPIKSRTKRAALADYLRATGHWLECVEGMQEVIVQYDTAALGRIEAKELLSKQISQAPRKAAGQHASVEIPVCYGGEFGPELTSIAEMLRLDEEDVVAMHTRHEYVVELIGFTPGFAYVSGLGGDLNIPRLGEPRQQVAPGSIGIAGGLTGLYALPGPGGWPLIGRTPVPLFRMDEQQPMLLASGTAVRFRAIDADAFQEIQNQ